MGTERWYLAALIVSSTMDAREVSDPVNDLQFRLVRAKDLEGARRRAEDLGLSEEHSYENAEGETVRWRFAGIADLRLIDSAELTDGTEVYSQLYGTHPSFQIDPELRARTDS